jgi:GWxTD domain-containing protein
VKKVFIVLAVLAFAASALAELSKYKDWDKSPEAYFLTPTERSEWKGVQTDEEAEKFIALYYARRGGEAFKQEISRRIAAADQQFKMARYKRGADSVRGRLLIVLGLPSRVSQSRAQEAATDTTGGVTAPAIDTRVISESAPIQYTWTYEPDKFPPSMDIGEVKAVILVDPAQGRDTLQNGARVERAMSTIAEKSIVNPNATLTAQGAAEGAAKSPAAAAGGAAPAAAAGAAAPAAAATGAAVPAAGAGGPPPIMPLPAEVKTALEAVPATGSGEAAFWSGTFQSAAGQPFLALQFYLPSNKPAFASGVPLKFGALVTDAAGQTVDSSWEDAEFREVDEAGRKDRVFDRSIVLPPGEYKGSFGLFAAEGQPPVTAASVGFRLEPKSDDFAVSPLILSSGLVPLTKRPGPTDPFVFGTNKPIRVEPKGDHVFAKQDSLWYFYTVANAAGPAGAPPAAAAAPAEPSGGAAAPAPTPAVEAPRPRVMTKINVQKDGQDAFAPFTGPADLQPVAAGLWGTGSEIPLASFEPGYYTFVITVRDLNATRGSAANKGIERKQDFTVLMPDGSLPPRPAKAQPARPAAKPKKP